MPIPSNVTAKLLQGGTNVQFGLYDSDNPNPTFINAELPLIAAAGAGHIRLPISMSTLENGTTGTLRSERYQWVKDIQSLARQNGLLTIIDVHNTGMKQPGENWWTEDYMWGIRYPAVADRHFRLITELAARLHADGIDPNWYVFQYANEPIYTGGSPEDDPSIWFDYQARLHPAVRAANPNCTIFAMANDWQGLEATVWGLETPFPDDNTIYDVHFYEPMQLSHCHTSGNTNNCPGKMYPATYTTWRGTELWNKARLQNLWDLIIDWRDEHGVFVHCSEFGTTASLEDSVRAAYLGDIVDIMRAAGIGYTNYEWHKNFGIKQAPLTLARMFPGTSTPPPPPPEPSGIGIIAQPPASVLAGTAFSVSAEIYDQNGARIATDNSTTFTLEIANNPTNAVLSGATFVQASNGVATFNNLRIDRAAQGLTLRVRTSTFNVVSNPVTITAVTTPPPTDPPPTDPPPPVTNQPCLNPRIIVPMLAPTITAPVANAELTDTTPTITWNAVVSASKYYLTIAVQGNTSSLISTEVVGTTYTVPSGSALLPNNTFTVSLRSVSADGNISAAATRTFSVIPTGGGGTPIPDVPVLSSPANAAVVTTTTPELSWSAAANAVSYDIQIDTSNTFPSPDQESTAQVPTTYTAAALTVGLTYYWRVRSRNSAGVSNWSSIRSFQVNVAPTTPTPSTPTVGENLIISTPNFTWSTTPNTDTYEIQIASDSGFTTLVQSSTGLTVASYTASALANGVYYWRVRSRNVVGASAYSAGRSFNINSSSTSWILNDTFSTPVAAPLPATRSSEPGAGRMAKIRDTGDYGSISGGDFTYVNGVGGSTFNLHYVWQNNDGSGFSRVQGRLFQFLFRRSGATQIIGVAKSLASDVGAPAYSIFGNSFYQNWTQYGNNLFSIPNNTDVILSVVVDATGAKYFLHVIGQPDTKLVFVDFDRNDSILYPFIGGADTALLHAVRVRDLPAPFNSAAGFNVADPVTLGASTTYTHPVSSVITFTVGTLPTSPSGAFRLSLRKSDANNYIAVEILGDGTMQFIKREAGVESVIAASTTGRVAAGHRVQIVADGSTLIGTSNKLNVVSGSSSFNTAQTTGGVEVFPSGVGVSAFTVYNRTLSPSQQSELEKD